MKQAQTEQLIGALTRSVPVVPRHAVARRLTAGILFGAALTALLVTAVLEVRADLHEAMLGFSFWMKCVYTVSLGIAAVRAIARLARPTERSLRSLWPIVIPVLLLAGVGIAELARTPTREWLAMWLGHSWARCPWIVLTLSVPIFIGLLWSFRQLAPTRLRAAGAAVGLAAGAWAATIYCLHCPEASAIFVLTWYSLGILLVATLGSLLGPWLLRW